MQEFNKGVYDYIIATDENGTHAEADSDDEPEQDGLQDGVGEELTPTQRAETNPDEDTRLEPASEK